MLWKIAILFLLAMVALAMIFGRPKAGDGPGVGRGLRRLFGGGARKRGPPDRRD